MDILWKLYLWENIDYKETTPSKISVMSQLFDKHAKNKKSTKHESRCARSVKLTKDS